MARLGASVPSSAPGSDGPLRWSGLAPSNTLDHGFSEFDNNTAERSLAPITLGRKNYLFMGSEGGGNSAAIASTLIETAKLNGVDPQAWLTGVLGRIAEHWIAKLDELMPWRYAEVSA